MPEVGGSVKTPSTSTKEYSILKEVTQQTMSEISKWELEAQSAELLPDRVEMQRNLIRNAGNGGAGGAGGFVGHAPFDWASVDDRQMSLVNAGGRG
jgi:hypothetical protein